MSPLEQIYAAENQRLSDDKTALISQRDHYREVASEVEQMRKALEFYANNWKCKPNKRYGGLEYSPNETLLDDCGNTARASLNTGAKTS